MARRSGVACALRVTSQCAALNTSGPDARGTGSAGRVVPRAGAAVSRVATVLVPSGRAGPLRPGWRTVRRTNRGRTLRDPATAVRSEAHVVVLDRQGVDPDRRRRDPAGEVPGLVVRDHQLGDLRPIVGGGQPLTDGTLPGGLVDDVAGRADVVPGEGPHLAVEALVRQEQPLLQPGVLQLLVPALD